MSTQLSTVRNELVSIQLLRALASLLVLLAHLQIKEKQYGDASALVWQNFRIGAIGVDIFFVLSGFIIFHVAGRSPSGWAAGWTFMKHRIIRVAPLYWALSLLALIVFLAYPELVNKTSSKPTALWESFLFFPTDKKLLIQNGWTLSYEFLFYLAFFTSILLLPAAKRVYLMMSAALLAVAYGLTFQPTSTIARFITDDLLLEFAFGVLIGAAYHHAEMQRYFNLRLGTIGLILASATIAWLGYFLVGLGTLRGITYGIPSALLVFSGLSLEKELMTFRRLKILGDSSYSLYLSHVLTLPAIGILWKQLGLNGTVANIYLLICLFIASVFAGIILYKYFELPLTNYLRKKLH